MNYRFCNILLLQLFLVGSAHASTYHEPINVGAIKRIIEQEIDHLFEPHKQSYAIKNYINQVKYEAVATILDSIVYYYSNHTHAKKEAIKETRRWAVEFVVNWAEYLVWETLKNPPVNPELFNAYDIVDSIKDIIRTQAQIHLKEYDRLTLVIQNLYQNIATLVDQEIKDSLKPYYF